jgi:hypothetical protein
VQKGYLRSRASSADGRVKQLYCSPKGAKLLEHISATQRERIARAYRSVALKDVESYLKVMTAMVSAGRRDWARRLTEGNTASRLYK